MKQQKSGLRILYVVLVWMLFLLPTVFSYAFVATDPTISLQQGKADFKNRSISENGVRLVGEVEFYYGSWIESEPDSVGAHTILSLPGFWTGGEFQGKPLGQDGYASYRFELEGLEPRSQLSINMDTFYCSFRLYFDSNLYATCGEPSKRRSEDVLGNSLSSSGFYQVNDSGTVSVTIEVGNSGSGGIFELPRLVSSRIYAKKTRAQDYAMFAALGILFTASTILFVATLSEPKKRRSIFEILFVVFLNFHWLTSTSGIRVLALMGFGAPYTLLRYFSLLFLVFALIFFLFYLRSGQRIKIPPFQVLLLSFLGLLGVGLLLPLHTYSVALLFILPFFVMGIYVGYLLSKEAYTSPSILNGFIPLAVWLLLLDCLFLENLNYGGVLSNGWVDPLSTLILVIACLMLGAFFHRFFHFKKTEAEAKELQIKQEQLNLLNLKGRFEPETIFNNLNAVQSIYHEDKKQGQEALRDFAKHLRYSVNSSQKPLVPFSDELSSLLDYVAFENRRQNKQISVLLDIEEENFLLPPLTLGPLLDEFRLVLPVQKEPVNLEISTKRRFRSIDITLSSPGIQIEWDSKKTEIERLLTRLRLVGGYKIRVKKKGDTSFLRIRVSKRRTCR